MTSGWFLERLKFLCRTQPESPVLKGQPSKKTNPERMVVSGGQTGVDRAALDAAMSLRIPVGGWCPKGRRAEDGRIVERYPLNETESEDYAVRTRLNVRDSDATLILSSGPLAGGTLLTSRYAKILNKKFRIIDLDRDCDVEQVSLWLLENGVETLNVAGPRESSVSGIYERSLSWLRRLFRMWDSQSG